MITKTALIPLKSVTNYSTLDIFKFICSFLVVAIHIVPFRDISESISFNFTQIVCRIAVPFFFICTGFFIKNKIHNVQQTKKYLLKVVKFYIIYCITYFLKLLYMFLVSEETMDLSPIKFLRDFLLVGFEQFWYLLGTIIGIIVLFLLVNKSIKNRNILLISLILYLIGTFINTYRYALNLTPFFNFFISIYLKIFTNARNGIFFGFPFITIGYLLKCNTPNLSNKTIIYSILLYLSLLIFETHFLFNTFNVLAFDMTILLLPLCITMFLGLLNIKVTLSSNFCLLLRQLSILIYGLHMFIYFFIVRFIEKIPILEVNSLIRYLLTIAFTMLFSYIIILLSKKQKFKWLSNLYQ